jgi:hypothetical protein
LLHAQTLRDEFGDDAKPHTAEWDYTTGKVPPGGIWVGIHNPKNGGDEENAAVFTADGKDVHTRSRAGRLYIEDLGLYQQNGHNPPSDPLLGVGWEPQNSGINNAPFLYTTVPTEKDFDAVLKITSQTSGPWSYVAIVVRRAGPPVGLGPEDGLDSNENFVTAGSFRPNADNGDEALLLVQNALNGTVGHRDILSDLAPEGAVGSLPVWVRISKRRAQFTAASSLDGVNWLEPSDAVAANEQLNAPGKLLEVGISFMRFSNPVTPEGSRPASVLDSFELHIVDSSEPRIVPWIVGVGILSMVMLGGGMLWRVKRT